MEGNIIKSHKLKIGPRRRSKLALAFVLGALLFAGGTRALADGLANEELTTVTDTSFVVTWTTTTDASTEIEYGVGGYTQTRTVEGNTKYHYCEVSGLYPNTTYSYRVKSGALRGSGQSVKTLARPTGDYLFSFAVLNDARYAEGKADDAPGAHSIAYSLCDEIVSFEVADIKAQSPAFIVINGNIVESWGTAGEKRGDQAKNQFLSKFASFSGAADLGAAAYRLNPTPGFYDKRTTTYYSSDWVADNLNPIYGTRTPAYTSADKNTNSVFNYNFAYKYYNFVFLDSVKANAAGGSIDLGQARDLITAEARKTFVFCSFPAYDFRGVSVDGTTYHDYPLDLPSLESGVVAVENDAAFRSLIESISYEVSGSRSPLTAAVISGHITDNYLRDIHGISYVRQGPAVQFPTGYSLYRVYTNGYVKSFYKTTGRDAAGKPYYESARDLISTEAGVPKDFLTSFWLGSNSMRNFTYTYAFIAGYPPQVRSICPVNNESGVALNRPLLITFNKRMATTGLANWVTITSAAGTLTTTASLDASRTALLINHPDLEMDRTYAVTLLNSQVRDEGGNAMGADYSFSFNTNGASRDLTPPAATLAPLAGNITTALLPSFLGTASDEVGIASVEYRIDGGSWLAAAPADGSFGSTSEVFFIALVTPLSVGSHLIELRGTDLAGNTTVSSFYAYTFTVAEERPTISLKINGAKALPGDPLAATPRIEVTVTSVYGPLTGRIVIDSSSTALTFVQADSNYLATHEVTTALADGRHAITVEAFDSSGHAATQEVSPLYVQSAGELTVQGVPLSYPNPFDPGATASATLAYNLSRAANITLTIHDLAGTLIAKKEFGAGDNGARAGYNAVGWDGRAGNGNTVGNGIYIYLIIADGKVAQRGKITVLKR